MGNFERAIEECKNAIEVDPEYGNSYNDIGTYHMKLGNYDEALIWFELALKAKRYDHYEFAHFNLGVLFERKGMWFEAVEEYRKAIEINPDYDPAKRAFLALQGKLN
jgi:Tfp pilus assembly protein PilF